MIASSTLSLTSAVLAKLVFTESEHSLYVLVAPIFFKTERSARYFVVVFRRKQGRCVLSQIVTVTIANCWSEDVFALHATRFSVGNKSGCSLDKPTQ